MKKRDFFFVEIILDGKIKWACFPNHNDLYKLLSNTMSRTEGSQKQMGDR